MFTYPDIRSQYKDHISGYLNLFRSSVHPYERSFSHILRVDEAQDGKDKDKRTFAQIIRNHFLRDEILNYTLEPFMKVLRILHVMFVEKLLAI